MKSKTSCFNKTIFLKNMTHFWPIWLMILGWNLFIMPFMIYNTSLQYRFSGDFSEKELLQMKSNDLLSIVSVYMNPVILFLFSVVAVMAVFSYLYNSKAANTIHALPVTRKELFLTNYVSGLLFLIVPEAVGFLLGTLVGAVCGYTNINHLLSGFLLACGISFVFYSFTTVIAMFTGQLLAVPVFAVILNFLFVGAKALIAMLMSMISYGMPLEVSGGRADILSPLYYILRHVRLNYDYTKDYSVCIGFMGKQVVAGYCLAAVAAVIAAYLIYRIRNMETAGSLISIPWISPVFRWGAAFCCGGLFSIIFCGIMGFSGSGIIFALALLTGVAFGAISFFGAQMFLEKGFRVFHKKRMIECAAFLLIFAGLYTAIELDLFGQEKKTPDASDIISVSLDNYNGAEITDQELIREVTDIHRQIIESKKEFEQYEASSQDTLFLYLRYDLKKGTLNRRYQIPVSKEMLYDSSTVIHRIAELMSKPSVYRGEVFAVGDDNIKLQEAQIDLYDENGRLNQYEFSQEEAEALYQAFLEDLKEGNFKEYIYNRYTYDDRDEVTYYNSISIDYTERKKQKDSKKKSVNTFTYGESVAAIQTANIGFDVNCKNIIAALMKTRAIESEKDLITMSEKMKLDEKNMPDSDYMD